MSAPGIQRHYLPNDFKINDWQGLEQYFIELNQRPINSVGELEQWLRDRSEMEGVTSEDLGWRYIRMTCDTTNKSLEEAYIYFVSEIEPKMAPFNNDLNLKFVNSPYFNELNKEKYFVYLRGVKREIEIYRDENVPLIAEIQQEQQKYASITGAMTVEMEGKELTLQQAANYLKNTNRSLREEAFKKINDRRLKDAVALDDLFDKLVRLRHRVANNADFDNFRDYMFAAMGRFDYTPLDCNRFHFAVAKEMVPLVAEINKEKQAQLKLDSLKPWDVEVDSTGKPALLPFGDGKDLLDKSIACFELLDPYFANCLKTMNSLGHFDLESRIGKAPGGYNYPLYESGYPFIFMNAASSLRDLETMVHEGGHAIHSVLTKDLELNAFKSCPSEVAELASMSMELISMDAWKVFFDSKEDLTRAKKEQLEGIIRVLPWIATVDKFQHWIYTHPEHTAAERNKAWMDISEEFSSHSVDWDGYEHYLAYSWQKQLHIYEVPFYYIEYGFAQLGAIAMWKQYTSNPAMALQNYKNALSLGYTKTIGEIYKEAGISFDFSAEYVKELSVFVKNSLKAL